MANPQEITWNQLIKGELDVDGSADINSLTADTIQVSGTTTLHGLVQTAQGSAVAQPSGIINVLSGDTEAIQSTTMVTSDSLIFLQKIPTIPASHIDISLNVRSITDAGGFTVEVDKATIDSQPVSWVIMAPA